MKLSKEEFVPFISDQVTRDLFDSEYRLYLNNNLFYNPENKDFEKLDPSWQTTVHAIKKHEKLCLISKAIDL